MASPTMSGPRRREEGRVEGRSRISLDDGSGIGLHHRSHNRLDDVGRAVHLADALVGDGTGHGLDDGAHLGQSRFMDDGRSGIAVEQWTRLQITRTAATTASRAKNTTFSMKIIALGPESCDLAIG